MIKLIKCEIYKLYKTNKIYIAIALVLVSLIYSVVSELLINSTNLAESSGAILPLSLLSSSSSFFIPIVIIISIVTLFSTEYSNGTLNLLLLKPFKRSSIILGKFLAVSFIFILMLLILSVLGYLFGGIMFGFNDVMVIKGTSISFKEGIFLTISSYITCIIPYMAFTSLIVLICTVFTDGATSGILSLIILILNLVLGSFIPNLSPLLITEYFNIYSTILEYGFLGCILGISISLIYLIVFLGLSILIFNKRDLNL